MCTVHCSLPPSNIAKSDAYRFVINVYLCRTSVRTVMTLTLNFVSVHVSVRTTVDATQGMFVCLFVHTY